MWKKYWDDCPFFPSVLMFQPKEKPRKEKNMSDKSITPVDLESQIINNFDIGQSRGGSSKK